MMQPLIWGPIADTYGRRFVFLLATVAFVVSNVIIACVPANLASLFVLRTVSAFGGSAIPCVACGTVVDLFPRDKRARPMTWVMTGMNLASMFGPLIGGFFASPGAWRGIFGFLACYAFAVFCLVILFLPETLRCRVGNGLEFCGTSTNIPRNLLVRPVLIQKRLVHDEKKYPRPGKLSLVDAIESIRDPFMITVWLTSGLTFAAFIAVNITLPRLLIEKYQFGHIQVGAALLPCGCSVLVGQFWASHLSDYLRQCFEQHHKFAIRKWEIRSPKSQTAHDSITDNSCSQITETLKIQDPMQGGNGSRVENSLVTSNSQAITATPEQPEMVFEYRLAGMLFGIAFQLSGLIIFACTIHFKATPATIITSTTLIGLGTAFAMAVPQGYIIDVSPVRAATVTALLGLFRWCSAGIVAVVIRPLRKKMGLAGFFFGLAAANVVGFALLAILLWRKFRWDKNVALFYMFRGGPRLANDEEQAPTRSRLSRFFNGARENHLG